VGEEDRNRLDAMTAVHDALMRAGFTVLAVEELGMLASAASAITRRPWRRHVVLV